MVFGLFVYIFKKICLPAGVGHSILFIFPFVL